MAFPPHADPRTGTRLWPHPCRLPRLQHEYQPFDHGRQPSCLVRRNFQPERAAAGLQSRRLSHAGAEQAGVSQLRFHLGTAQSKGQVLENRGQMYLFRWDERDDWEVTGYARHGFRAILGRQASQRSRDSVLFARRGARRLRLEYTDLSPHARYVHLQWRTVYGPTRRSSITESKLSAGPMKVTEKVIMSAASHEPGSGTSAKSQDRGSTSAFGGKAVMRRTSTP